MPTKASIDVLSEAIDGLVGIQPRKIAVTDPQLRELLHIAHLLRQMARSACALAIEGELTIWQRLTPVLTSDD